MKYKRKLPDHLRPTKSKKNNAVKSGRKNKVDVIKWNEFDNANGLADLEQTVNNLMAVNSFNTVIEPVEYYSEVSEDE